MSKRPKSRKRYVGEFLKPIYRSSEAEQQQIDKFINLFAVYDIDLDGEDDPFLLLAIKLANAHVPGLRIVEHRGGRERKWKGGLWKDLVRDVAARKAKSKMSTRAAIRALREEDPKWAQFTQENLETRHREARQTRSTARRNTLGPCAPNPETRNELVHAPLAAGRKATNWCWVIDLSLSTRSFFDRSRETLVN